MKSAKTAFIIGIIVLMGAGCASAPVAQTNSNANIPAIGTDPDYPASGTFAVTIDQDGEFNPVTAYVTKGTTVTFKNTSDKIHHLVPSSDPKLKLLPIDSKTDMAPGDSFSVTFDQVGRFLYSDSKNTAFGGAVDVTDNTNSNTP